MIITDVRLEPESAVARPLRPHRGALRRDLSDALGGPDDRRHGGRDPGRVAAHRVRRRRDPPVARGLRGRGPRAAPHGRGRRAVHARGAQPRGRVARAPDAHREPRRPPDADPRRARDSLRPRREQHAPRRPRPERARAVRAEREVVVAGRSGLRHPSRRARTHSARRADRARRERSRRLARSGLRRRVARGALGARRPARPRRARDRRLRPPVGSTGGVLGRRRAEHRRLRRARGPRVAPRGARRGLRTAHPRPRGRRARDPAPELPPPRSGRPHVRRGGDDAGVSRPRTAPWRGSRTRRAGTFPSRRCSASAS